MRIQLHCPDNINFYFFGWGVGGGGGGGGGGVWGNFRIIGFKCSKIKQIFCIKARYYDELL